MIIIASPQAMTSATTQPTTNSPAGAYKAAGKLELPRDDKPVWQIQFLDERLGKKLQQAFGNNNWGSQFSTLRVAVPSSATDGKRIYVNWLGIVFAADATVEGRGEQQAGDPHVHSSADQSRSLPRPPQSALRHGAHPCR